MSASLAEPMIAAPAPAGRVKRGGVPVIHAEPPALDPALGGDAALRRIGLAGLDHLSRNEAAALAGMPEPPVGEIAGKILRRRWRAAKKRGKEFAEQAPEQRHRLRIALKKLRYTAEATASLYPPDAVAPLTARLKRLQDELGHLNDVRVGHEILAALASDDGPDTASAEAGGRMFDWHERRLIDREPKLREHLRELFEAQPFWHG